jgi:hypothetical protein
MLSLHVRSTWSPRRQIGFLTSDKKAGALQAALAVPEYTPDRH